MGQTPLHEAAKLNSAAVCIALISGGGNVNGLDASGDTPLAYAAQADAALSAGALITEGMAVLSATNSVCGKAPLHIAAEQNSYRVAELILTAGVEVSSMVFI